MVLERGCLWSFDLEFGGSIRFMPFSSLAGFAYGFLGSSFAGSTIL